MQVQPYLMFEGRCEEALEFYRTALGAEVKAMMRCKESPDPHMSMPGSDEKIMHASFRVGDTEMFASDGRCQGPAKFQGFSLCLTLRSEADAKRLFTALEPGGQVQMPLTRTFYSPLFGMVADRFGVSWMIYVVP